MSEETETPKTRPQRRPRLASKTFGSIKHPNDVDVLEKAIKACNGSITSMNPDYESGYCEFTVNLPDHVTARQFWDQVDDTKDNE